MAPPVGDDVEIPGGVYRIGCDDTSVCLNNPTRAVSVGSFFIGRLEVTVDEYDRCVKSMSCADYRTALYIDEVAVITAPEAESYCRWSGGRLPTDVEWEVAARGRDGRIFPWGTVFSEALIATPVVENDGPNAGRVHYRGGTRPGGASPFGLRDMGGSLAEFTATTDNTVHVRGAPTGLASTDVNDFSAVRINIATHTLRAGVRCVHVAR